MRERYPTVMMSELQRGVGCVLEVRQVIAGETVTQCVVRPFHDASGSTRLLEQLPETISRRDIALVFARRQEPLAQIRLDRHKAALRRL